MSIGSFVAGPVAGLLVETYVCGDNSNRMWYELSGIGLTTTAAMVVYNATPAKSEV